MNYPINKGSKFSFFSPLFPLCITCMMMHVFSTLERERERERERGNDDNEEEDDDDNNDDNNRKGN